MARGHPVLPSSLGGGGTADLGISGIYRGNGSRQPREAPCMGFCTSGRFHRVHWSPGSSSIPECSADQCYSGIKAGPFPAPVSMLQNRPHPLVLRQVLRACVHPASAIPCGPGTFLLSFTLVTFSPASGLFSEAPLPDLSSVPCVCSPSSISFGSMTQSLGCRECTAFGRRILWFCQPALLLLGM